LWRAEGSPRPKPARFISTTSTELSRRITAGAVRSRDDVKLSSIQDGRPCEDIRWPADPVLVPFGGAANGGFRQRVFLAGLVPAVCEFLPARGSSILSVGQLAPLAQPVEATDLDSVRWRFESVVEHQSL
jgi:hypothetical protein